MVNLLEFMGMRWVWGREPFLPIQVDVQAAISVLRKEGRADTRLARLQPDRRSMAEKS